MFIVNRSINTKLNFTPLNFSPHAVSSSCFFKMAGQTNRRCMRSLKRIQNIHQQSWTCLLLSYQIDIQTNVNVFYMTTWVRRSNKIQSLCLLIRLQEFASVNIQTQRNATDFLNEQTKPGLVYIYTFVVLITES